MPFGFSDPPGSDMTPVVTPLLQNGAANRPIYQQLTWSLDFNPAMGKHYRYPRTSIWFSTDNPPKSAVLSMYEGTTGGAVEPPPRTAIRDNGVVDGLISYRFDPGVLEFSTTYYYVIQVWAGFGMTASPVLSFTTEATPLPDAPGIAPSAAPLAGTGIETGVHKYGYTRVNITGESVASPVATVTHGPIAEATAWGVGQTDIAGSMVNGRWYHYAVSFVGAGGETLASGAANGAFTGSGTGLALTGLPISPNPLTTARKVYRSGNQGSSAAAFADTHKLVTTLANNTTTTYSDTTADGALGAAAPVSNTTAANRTALSAIAAGPAATTARKLYRTVAGGTQLKLVTTLADNVTTTYTDSTPDASLGANAP